MRKIFEKHILIRTNLKEGIFISKKRKEKKKVKIDENDILFPKKLNKKLKIKIYNRTHEKKKIQGGDWVAIWKEKKKNHALAF